ncbi:glycylpeptide N-tetradecanoyltransferase, partial [Coelomomyces lativittatus]
MDFFFFLDQLKNQSEDGSLEPNKPFEQLRQEPFKLPESFEWVEVDVENDAELSELYELLANNYVEDEDAIFRFAYPKHLLKWALRPPGWKKGWHIGVRVKSSRKLVSFISGIPATILVKSKTLSIVEINFLCVLRKLRSKRLAPVLIKEITRRCHLEGIFQAMYTAGKYLPGAITSAAYWHRSINPEKLLDVGFSYLPKGLSLEKYIHRLRIPE